MNAKNTKKSCGLGAGGKDKPLKHQLIHTFWTLGPAFTRWAETQMGDEGITPQRMRLLGYLYENGATMMCDLRDELGVTATNITALVDALEKDGRVERAPHPTDRRVTMISLTNKMQKVMSENCGSFRDKVSELFCEFSQSEQEQFLKLLLKMKAALVDRNVLNEIEPATTTGAKSKEL